MATDGGPGPESLAPGVLSAILGGAIVQFPIVLQIKGK